MTASYCSIDDIRNYTKVQTGEYSDDSVTLMIENAQDDINEWTHTSFAALVTATEYYQRDDKAKFFFTEHYPIDSITSLSVDDNDDTTYTVIPSTDYDYWDYGLIELNSEADITHFPKYNKSTKLVYVYGYSSVPGIIKYLTILLVVQQIEDSPELRMQIDGLKNRVSYLRITN